MSPSYRPPADLSALVSLDEPFYRRDGRWYCPFNWWRFTDELAGNLSRLTLYVPARDGGAGDAPEVSLTRAQVAGRFFYQRVTQYYAQVLRGRRRDLRRSARRLAEEHDVVMIRVPSPAAMTVARAAWRAGKPTVLLVGGDILTANAYTGARGFKGRLAAALARRMRRQELAIAGGSVLTALWGADLIPTYAARCRNVATAGSPNISRSLISRRPDVAMGEPMRIIRVARLLPNKGLDVLLEALAEMKKRGSPVKLDLAGGGDDEQYVAFLRRRAEELGLASDVVFRGQMAFGPKLFELYERADVHVMSSLSEGLPRCVTEARVFGVPTVATRVGALPTIMRHGRDGLLVDPGNSGQIVEMVLRLREDGELRRRIIREGYRLAETDTREYQARRLAALVARACAGQALGAEALDLRSTGEAAREDES
jgi:glycosyltransferase involved in cell wall biosynthesis